MKEILRSVLVVLFVIVAPYAALAQAPDGITVFAAASLTNVLQDIGRSYESTTHRHVAFSFAASMTLAKQIQASSGPDVFISADSDSMNYLDVRGLIAKPTRRDLLANSLVLVAPADSRVMLDIRPGFELADALKGGRLALATPEAVPAGKYGQTALMELGVWESVSGHLALGEDVRATLAYVARGEAPLGIVYATDARVEPRVRVVGTFPANTHEPIVYPVALVKDAKPIAATFLAFLREPQARVAFEKAGFMVLMGK